MSKIKPTKYTVRDTLFAPRTGQPIDGTDYHRYGDEVIYVDGECASVYDHEEFERVLATPCDPEDRPLLVDIIDDLGPDLEPERFARAVASFHAECGNGEDPEPHTAAGHYVMGHLHYPILGGHTSPGT